MSDEGKEGKVGLPFKYADFSNNMGRGLTQKEIKEITAKEGKAMSDEGKEKVFSTKELLECFDGLCKFLRDERAVAIRNLIIQSKSEIDEKYVEGKAMRLIEEFGYRFKGKHFPGHLKEATDFIAQIIGDVKGRKS